MGNVQALGKVPAAPSWTEKIIQALKSRCSLQDLRAALKKQNLPCGASWADLQGHAEDKGSNGEKLRQFLHEFFCESILASEKFVKLYEFEDDLANTLKASLKAATVGDSEFSAAYPLPLASKELPSATDEPTLVEVRELSAGDYALVYCSVRSYDDRVQYKYDQLPQQVRQTYGEIDQLITVRKVYFQAYDVIIIRPSLGRLEVLVDQPKKTGHIHFDISSLRVFSVLVNSLPALAPVYQGKPVNIFKAISGIYYAPTEGTIKSLAFRTQTGSRKHEKMITSDDDLRSEKFHHGGMAAVGHKISPYEIDVEWEFKIPPGKALLSLSAQIRELNMEAPTLTGCVVSAENQTAVLQAFNKIVKYLT